MLLLICTCKDCTELAHEPLWRVKPQNGNSSPRLQSQLDEGLGNQAGLVVVL
jgi:hypothetical protein